MARTKERGYLTIGEVLAALRPEFPDLTPSKIRFLESRGLISPARTASGYRQFSPADLERLRFILSSQRLHYLPLKVIKERLDSRGPEPLPEFRDATEELAAPPGPQHLGLEEAARASRLSVEALTALADFGLLGRSSRGELDAEDVELARAAGVLLRRGLEPRHLRMYKVFAEREGHLLRQVLAPLARQRRAEEKRALVEAAAETLRAARTIKHILLRREVRSLLHGRP